MAQRGGSLSNMSVAQIERELRKRARFVGTLSRRRDRLAAKLDVMDARIASMGGLSRAGGRGRFGVRKRPKNATNLVEALAKVLANKTLSVTEVAEVVQKAGYKTTSPSFRTIVNQTLINNSGRFKRVSRGQYTTK